ncbi:MAG TPA: hypothetical protein VGL46_09465 [Pseudonocardiaceae bacterium]
MPLWIQLGVHWHGYAILGPGPIDPRTGRRRRLRSRPGALLRTPAAAAAWVHGAARVWGGTGLDRWDPDTHRWPRVCPDLRAADINRTVTAMLLDGTSAYLRAHRVGHPLDIALEAPTAMDCPRPGCPPHRPSPPIPP